MDLEVLPVAEDSSPPGAVPNGEPAPGLHADPLLASVLLLLAMTFFQRLVGFVRAILFCRWLEPEELGQWDMAWGFLMLAAPMAVLSLPGTFGRYVEQYRQRGQLRVFLRRTAVVCALLSAAAVGILYGSSERFAQLIFADRQQLELVRLLAGSLLAVVAYNYVISLLTALRSMRLVAALEFANSLAFAALGIAALCCGPASAGSVVLCYGGACLLCCLVAARWVRRAWRASPQVARPEPQRAFWSKLARFAAWIVLINLLTNLFLLADRYLIVHFTPGSAEDALALVGQYHSARVVPLLLMSLSGMMGAMLLPHLSHDWEAGRTQRVSAQLNLFLKLLAAGLTAAAAGVLLAAPLLFDVAFAGKYHDGLAVLPWTLVSAVWAGLGIVAQMYLLCVERAGRAALALLIGLLLSVGLNMLLLPRCGLLGVVWATAAANLAVLVLVVWFARRLGLRRDRGLCALLATPLALPLGGWAAALVLLVVAWAAVRGNGLFSQTEKQHLAAGLRTYGARLRGLMRYRVASDP